MPRGKLNFFRPRLLSKATERDMDRVRSLQITVTETCFEVNMMAQMILLMLTHLSSQTA